MKLLRIPLRVVFYKDEGAWVAHCLEFDLMGDGPTKEIALDRMVEATTLQVEVAVSENNPANLFKPASGKVFEMYAAGKDVTVADFHVEVESIRIDDSTAREYLEESEAEQRSLAYA